MRKLIVALFFIPFISSAQNGIDNLWMLGYNGGFGGINVDFLSGAAVITNVNRPMNFSDISAIICDNSGKTLFYTNGAYIANSIDDTMQNGSGLSPSAYTSSTGWDGLHLPQAAIILPNPGDLMKYYIIHGTIDDNVQYAYKVYYSEIDMTLNSGLGAVTTKNNIFFNDTLIAGRITSVKHANGRDWWVVFHKAKSDLYYIYYLDPTGIHYHSAQHIGVVRDSYIGAQVCFSPDGSKFACYGSYYASPDGLDIMDFDRCNGIFSNPVHSDISIHPDSAGAGGVAFSSDSKVLYVSAGFWVYQFDLTASDILASKLKVATWDGYNSPAPPLKTTFYLAQLAPDGKIYISSTNSVLSMHVINNPNVVGLGCDVCQHCVPLSRYNGTTIPNHPNYHLGALKGSTCDTLGIGIEEIAAKITLSIYPNPVINHEITFSYSSTGETKMLELYNIDGKIVASYNLPQWSSIQHLKLPKIAQGIYMARLISKEQIVNVKFIVD